MTDTDPRLTDPHAGDDPAPPPRFVAWPLWIAAAGALGTAALFIDSRPDSEEGFPYPVTADHVVELGHLSFRISGALGYVAALTLLVAAALWRQRVVRRYPWSLGAGLVVYASVASAALMTLAYGWRASLGNYMPGGLEEDAYDKAGLYVYYMVNDFGPFIAGVPLVAAAYGIAYMAFAERLLSRVLGGASAVVATLLLGATLVTGIPGLPGLMIAALAVAGAWLAVGRSPAIVDAAR